MNLKQRTAVFKALGHPARLKMVDALGKGELCVCDLVKIAGLQWSTVSRHLAILKEAGVVTDDKRGKQVFYRLSLCCVADMNRCLDGKTEKDAAHCGVAGKSACGCG